FALHTSEHSPPPPSSPSPYPTLFRSGRVLLHQRKRLLRIGCLLAQRLRPHEGHENAALQVLAPRAGERLALAACPRLGGVLLTLDRKSTRLNSSHGSMLYAVFCLQKL